MPRGGGRSSSGGRSSGGGGGFFSRGPARSAAPAAPRPPMRQAPPRAAPQQSSGGGGFGSMIAQGMAFGAGSAIAHEGIRHMMGGGHGHGGGAPAQQAQQAPMEGGAPAQQQVDYSQQQVNPCQDFNLSFVQCLQMNSADIGLCQTQMSMLQQCEQDYAMSKNNFQ